MLAPRPTGLAATVEPVPGLAPWVGGKRHLAARLCERIDRAAAAGRVRCYAEPFMGMAGIFLRRRRRVESEALNDINGEVVNLFRTVQRHPDALAGALDFTLASRAEFDRIRALDPATLTDVERAARFFYLAQNCFGGRLSAPSFAVSPLRRSRWSVARLVRHLGAVHRRLAGVFIERLPYADFIARYDAPSTLFYLDPPYWGCETYYGRGIFARADFERLAELLGGIRGRFILSINDVPDIRKLFHWARVERVPVTYKLAGTKKVTELVISGRR